MNKFKLTAEEKKIEAEIERGEYRPIRGKKLREMMAAIAALRKDRMLTIRVNSQDIQQIRRVAQSKGIRYQSLISEIIHRVARELAKSS